MWPVPRHLPRPAGWGNDEEEPGQRGSHEGGAAEDGRLGPACSRGSTERRDAVAQLVAGDDTTATAAETPVSSSSPKLIVSGSSAEHPSRRRRSSSHIVLRQDARAGEGTTGTNGRRR